MEEFIQKLTDGKNLTTKESEKVMEIIMSGKATCAQIKSFLRLLDEKGETSKEIAGFAKIMRKFAETIKPEVDRMLVDMCGTGGDALKTFNISTTSMFIVAACGIPVAKHGNRAITSKCGSADVLEELGINLNLSFGKIKEGIEKVGIGFMFAPAHHLAMKHVMPARQELNMRTVFNILGPLTNPANANAQVMGVFNSNLTETLAEVFRILGIERAMVVHGEPGLDEISTMGETKISELYKGRIETYHIMPEDFGLRRAKEKDLVGRSTTKNARILKSILRGEDAGPRTDIVLLNSAAGIVLGGRAKNLNHGLNIARDVLDRGEAYEKLREFIEFAR
ncbi:anthranilate phosphoribosyltransferase [Candidatus Parcubacteria bacterium]|nr:anthranilate phosphoribosyltransferase [Candidatus Parcubacteria bacterium]